VFARQRNHAGVNLRVYCTGSGGYAVGKTGFKGPDEAIRPERIVFERQPEKPWDTKQSLAANAARIG